MLIVDFAYVIYIIIVSPYYLFKFATSHYHRQGLSQRFGFVDKRSGNRKCIWLHGASVGEINALEILIKQLKELHPDYELAISTTTPSAQKLVKKKYPDITSFFFPIDLSIIVNQVLTRIRPNIIVLIEQELWLNLIRLADIRNIRVILLNGRMTKHSARRYRLIKPLIKKIWNKASYLCVQNKEYLERFRHLGVRSDKLKITGNMKYDLLNTATARPQDISYRQLFGIGADDLIIVAGSTHPPEEETLLDAYAELKTKISNLRLIIAPRHPFRFDDVAKLIQAKGFECRRRSNSDAEAKAANSIILIDTLGELNNIYQAADVVFVGGSMIPRGGQSILEPAAAGKPIIFGYDMSNFQDIADRLIKDGSAISVKDKTGLYQALFGLLAQPEKLNQIGSKAKAIISRYQGATAQNMEFIKKLVDPTSQV